MIPLLDFTVDTDERPGGPFTFEATAADAADILEAIACYYVHDEGHVTVSDGRAWSGQLVLGGFDNPFDAFIEGLRG